MGVDASFVSVTRYLKKLRFLKGHEEVSKDYKATSSDTKNIVISKKLRWKCGMHISCMLGGGFKYFLFSPLGKWSNLTSIFFKWVETTNYCWWLKSQTTTWDGFKNLANNGVNYQPQLVSRISAINSSIVVVWIFFVFGVLILPRWCNGWPAKAVSRCQCYILSRAR